MMGYSSLVNGNLITAIEGEWRAYGYMVYTLMMCVEVQFHDKRKSVYRCKVFGSRRSGKTTIVRGLVGKHQVTFIVYYIQSSLICPLGTDNTR